MKRVRSMLRKVSGFHAATFIIVAVILWLTLAPHPVGDRRIFLFPGADKIVHGIMFFTLAASYCAEEYILGRLTRIKVWCAAAATMMFGAMTEVLQDRMHIGRSFEWADILADTTGALSAALLALYFIYKSRSSN
ncbi:MAG: VanZ family protein [Bacteroidales bacterium]|nr:VanZ family protein [Bacteroidales bacterium]